MQHVRDLGQHDSIFVEAPGKKRDRDKLSLEDALRQSSLHDAPRPSYQSQQDLPDDLAGFQPDMDPGLREVLEALDDEAYVDDEEDFFGQLTQNPAESTPPDLRIQDDDWKSDTTEKPLPEHGMGQCLSDHEDRRQDHSDLSDDEDRRSLSDQEDGKCLPDHGDGKWMEEFSKFKAKGRKAKPPDQDSAITGVSSLASTRRKKRKGAMTSSSGYSMTSSSLARTEGQSILDARFDKIEEEYAADDVNDALSVTTGMSNMSKFSVASSQAPELTSAGLNGMLDDFLGGYSMSGKRRLKKGGYQSGMEQLDELRRQLGPVRRQRSIQ